MKFRKTYRFYMAPNKVIAVSSYEGKPVRGVAKCDPNDIFSYEKGEALAAARCNLKIAEKRYKRAGKKLDEAIRMANEAYENVMQMRDYFESAGLELGNARAEIDKILKELIEP